MCLRLEVRERVQQFHSFYPQCREFHGEISNLSSNARGETPFSRAANGGHLGLVKQLLAQEDVNAERQHTQARYNS